MKNPEAWGGLRTSVPEEKREAELALPQRNSSEVSLDGEHFIPVPTRLKKLISVALRLQKRIDKHLSEVNLDFDSTVDIVKGINCHKTVLFARGEVSFEDLKNSEVEAEHNGHPEILSLANKNPDNLLITSEDIEEYAREHSDEYPFSVHVLTQNGKKWTPAHSVLLLGEDQTGELVCFHKAGPYMDMPFELTTLHKAIQSYDSEASLFLMLPVPSEEEGTSEQVAA